VNLRRALRDPSFWAWLAVYVPLGTADIEVVRPWWLFTLTFFAIFMLANGVEVCVDAWWARRHR